MRPCLFLAMYPPANVRGVIYHAMLEAYTRHRVLGGRLNNLRCAGLCAFVELMSRFWRA